MKRASTTCSHTKIHAHHITHTHTHMHAHTHIHTTDFLQGEAQPFNRVLYCNIGDCHAMGQKPLTFVRQLVAACADPDTLLHSDTYPSDVRERARAILEDCGGQSVGKQVVSGKH